MKKGKKWYRSFSSWLVIIACIILIPVLLGNLYIIYQSKTNKDKVPSLFGYKPFIVLSGSMEGKIHKGDLIITKQTNPKKLKVNDIIAFRDSENTVTTHRIIDIVERDGKNYFITKGDNNSTQDRNLVSLDDVEGIYVTRITGIGSMMKSLSEPTTILMVVLVITILFVIGFAISNKHDRELEKKEFMEYKLMKEREEKGREKEEVLDLDIENVKTKSQLEKQYDDEDYEELLRLKKLKEQQEREDRDREELLRLRQLKQEQEEQQRQELLRLKKIREQQERELEEQEYLRLKRRERQYDDYDYEDELLSYRKPKQQEDDYEELLRLKKIREEKETELKKQQLLDMLLRDDDDDIPRSRYRDQ